MPRPPSSSSCDLPPRVAISAQASLNFDATCDLQPCQQQRKRKSLPPSLLGLGAVKAILAGLGLRRQRLLGPPPPSLVRVVARPHRPPLGLENGGMNGQYGVTQDGVTQNGLDRMDGLTQNGKNGKNGMTRQTRLHGKRRVKNGMARQTRLQRKRRVVPTTGLPSDAARIEGKYTPRYTTVLEGASFLNC